MKTIGIFINNFKLIVITVIAIQLVSMGIYWSLIGRPLVKKTAEGVAAELIKSRFIPGNPTHTVSMYIWRPLATQIKSSLGEKLQSEVKMIKSQENNELYLYFYVPSQNGFYKYNLSQLNLYAPRAIILSSITLLILSLIIAAVLARIISNPIQRINAHIQQIGDGDLNNELALSRIKEINELTDKINQMQNKINQLLNFNRLNYAGFSHDLKTPVTQLKLAVELIRDDIDDKKFSQLQKSISHLHSKIEEFLLLAKMLMDESKQPVILSDLIKQIVAEYEVSFPDIIFTYNDNNNHAEAINIYGIRLHRIIDNLISNSVKHAHGPVKISLAAKEPDNYIIEISDSGFIEPQQVKYLNQDINQFWEQIDSKGSGSLGVLIIRYLSLLSGWNVKFSRHKNSLTAQIEIKV